MWHQFRIWVERNEKAVKFLVWIATSIASAAGVTWIVIQTVLIPEIQKQFQGLTYVKEDNVEIEAPKTIDGKPSSWIEWNWETLGRKHILQCDDGDIAITAMHTATPSVSIPGLDDFGPPNFQAGNSKVRAYAMPIIHEAEVNGYEFFFGWVAEDKPEGFLPGFQEKELVNYFIVCMRPYLFEKSTSGS